MNLYITRLNGIENQPKFLQCMTAEIAHWLGFREMGIYYYNANAESDGNRSVRYDSGHIGRRCRGFPIPYMEWAEV